jgi:hypothetical protein
MVKRIFSGILNRGVTSVPVGLHGHANGLYLLHVVIGGHEAVYTLTPATGSFSLSGHSLTKGNFSKCAAADWLQASKTGYASFVKSIDSYIDTIDITLNAPSAPDFGPNVKIFDPSMQMGTIQSTMDGYAGSTSEFSTQRVAYLFKPGMYNVTVTVNYYIQALGLGRSPDDVTINGSVQSRGKYSLGYFWRGAENMGVSPTGGPDIWAVSQAAPFRRMHVKGAMNLADGGQTSGGWISDSKIDGMITSASQQQWYTRSSHIGGWNDGVWNMFFHGTIGAPADNWPTGVYTTIATVPIVREKPFLTIDSAGNYSVFVPAFRTDCLGTTWENGPAAGELVAIDQFYIARSSADNETTINAALSQGKNLLLTPGIYNLTGPIEVTRPNTVVLGIGFPSLVSQNGTRAMKVADAEGITIACVLFDASGPIEVPVQLQVGEAVNTLNHSANPICLFDIFSRIGGYGVGKVAASVILNSNNVILDHCWIWRADHGAGAGWTSNTSKNGMIVNGNDVICYGQFMEHHQQYQTVWKGNNGRNYFFQNEMPYDVQNQTDVAHDGINGWASYKVGDSVTTHEAWGLGIYANFNQKPIKVDYGIQTPDVPGIKFHHIYLKSLGSNQGEIANAINNMGPSTNPSHTDTKINEYIGGQ